MAADLLGVVGAVAVESVLCRRAALSISTVGVCPLCCSLCPLRRLPPPVPPLPRQRREPSPSQWPPASTAVHSSSGGVAHLPALFRASATPACTKLGWTSSTTSLYASAT
uniref:Uncharacterized protein n=1 Tax=Emiliania huxleyi TaxID=2903 RepID=A0A7S3WU49_EMIHU